MTEQEILEQLEQLDRLHDENRFREQIEIIEALPEEVQGQYRIRCRLGRALNNVQRYQDAMEVLESIRAEGEQDTSWWSRMGFALYYLGRDKEAREYFLTAQRLEPKNVDAKTFLALLNVNGNAWSGGGSKKEGQRSSTPNGIDIRPEAPRRQKPAGKANDWQGRGWDDMDEEE